MRPDLYVPNPDGSVGPALKIGTGGVHEDVPRVPNGDGSYSALLGDPRNDENVMIAGAAQRPRPVLQPGPVRSRQLQSACVPGRTRR